MNVEIHSLCDAKSGGKRNKKSDKDFKEAVAKSTESVKKVEELTASKANLESQLNRMTKMCYLQQESMDRNSRNTVQATNRIDEV